MLFKIYGGLADSCGVPQLAKKLNKVMNLQCRKHKLAFIINLNVSNADLDYVLSRAYTIKRAKFLKIP